MAEEATSIRSDEASLDLQKLRDGAVEIKVLFAEDRLPKISWNDLRVVSVLKSRDLCQLCTAIWKVGGEEKEVLVYKTNK